jgi:hypothetical protein
MNPVEYNISQTAFEQDYLKPIHKVGTIASIILFLGMFLPSLLLYLIYAQAPGWSEIATGFALAMTYAAPFYLSEPISYYPIVGNAGWYLTATVGNGSNLRVPCGVVAQQIAEVKEGTREGELVATIGIATSVLISIPAILIGALLINTIQQYFSPWLLSAFKTYLLPAVFGAVWGQFILRGWKYAPIAIILMYVPMVLKVPGAWNILIGVLGTMLIGWVMLKYFKIEA